MTRRTLQRFPDGANIQGEKTPPTPFFVLDEAKVVASVAAIRAALQAHWPNSVLSFSVKTNSWPALLRILVREGVWAEVVSGFELNLALACGFSRGRLVCNGASKSPDYISDSLNSGAILHLDSIDELRAMASRTGDSPVEFGVRVNATEADFDADPLSGPMGSRFGLSLRDGDLDRLDEMLRAKPMLKLRSLHLHCNTRTRGLRGYEWLARFFARLVRTRGYADVTSLDIGGSFGHDFDRPGDSEGRWPSWSEYFGRIAAVLRDEGFSPERLRLVIEPGSGLISGCADYFTRCVGERVLNGRRVLQIDGSRVHVDPHLARQSFAGAVAVRVGGGRREVPGQGADYLSGATCLEKDRLILGDGELREASVGDVLCVRKAGGYSYGLSPLLFITGAPAVAVRDAAGGLSVVQRRLAPEDYLRLFSEGVK